MATTNGTQELPSVVPASATPRATEISGVAAESPQALSSAQSVPTFKMFIDALRSR